MNNDFVNDDIRDIILERDGYLEQLEDYKSRCEKASAELKNWEKLDLDNLLVAIRRTQNILQNGGNNENI